MTTPFAPPSLASLNLFDVSPVAMLLEDYSELKALFDQWQKDGVTELRPHLEQDPERIVQCSRSIRLLQVNAQALNLYGARDFHDLASQLDSVLRDDMHHGHLDELEQLWSGSGRFQSQTVNYTLNGQRRDLLLKGVVLPGHEARWDRVLVVIEDITELESARRQVAASEQYSRGLFEHAPVSLWVTNYSAVRKLLADVRQRGIMDFRTFTEVHPEFIDRCLSEVEVVDVNHHTLILFKAATKADLLTRLSEIFREEMRYQFREQLIQLWEGVLFQQREITGYALDGSIVHTHLQFWVAPGHETQWDLALIALADITARKKAEHYLEYLGQHDVLTGLKNRAFFTDEIERLRRKGSYPLTAIVLDMNNLKQANDELGHTAGDALLRRCGEVITQAAEKPAQAARTGGDEFIILMPGAMEKDGQRLMDDLNQLILINNQYYASQPPLSLSMGMATCSTSEWLDDTLRRADLAMYEKKREYHANLGRSENERQG